MATAARAVPPTHARPARGARSRAGRCHRGARDPQAVARIIEAGGPRAHPGVGGRTDTPALGLKGQPLKLSGRVRCITEGDYRVTGPMFTGMQLSLGRTAVIDVRGVSVTVRAGPIDLNRFRRFLSGSCGVRLRRPKADAAMRSTPRPEFELDGSSAAGGCCTSQQRNTHSTESREVRYRWHPWFGLVVWVHLTRVSQAQDVVRCALTPELGARATEIPLWMFDAAACVLMNLADEPTVDVEALRDLNTLLRHACGPTEAAVPMLQAEHRALSSAGGAHAIDSEAAATGDSTGAVPRVTQRAELGVI